MKAYHDNHVNNIRYQFTDLLLREQFVTDKTGVKTIEIIGASFIANEPFIFGSVNVGYVDRELEWYNSQSLNVNDIPGGPPPIWKQVSAKDPGYEGMINSNYGWMIYSQFNGSQYANVLGELRKNPLSRRAIMIYTRPSMHTEYNFRGMSDFVCTNAVQFLIRDGFLDMIVQMRSNDAWAGYRNDYAWQVHVRDHLLVDLNRDLGLDPGLVVWQVGSLHMYEKDFYLVDNFENTGSPVITKKEYREKYPESPWVS